ncbi:SCP2 sterol-binding domain-containing protein [Phlyctochytrium arcticum]|nr:SCP2 sterol-binding domain-containing protein [Phlyctochytrium arcticum]
MSVNVPGYNSGAIFEQIRVGMDVLDPAEKAKLLKQTNAIFEIVIKNAAGQEQSWTLDFKNGGKVTAAKPEGKADITINMSDDTFGDLASGKLNGQKAFMSGKLKVKGNMMLATKLDTVLKAAKPAAGAAAAPAAKPAAPADNAQSPTAATPARPAGTVEVPGFASSAVFKQIKTGIDAAPPAQRSAIAKKVKAIFQFDVKNGDKAQTWTLNLKDESALDVTAAPPSGKADIIINISDKDFVDLAGGKLNGQKAFMQGKLKVKGNMMLATKLDSVLKELKPKEAKL